MRENLLNQIPAAPPASRNAILMEEVGHLLKQISVVLSDYGALTLLEQLSQDNLMLLQSPIALADAMVRKFFSDVAIKGLV